MRMTEENAVRTSTCPAKCERPVVVLMLTALASALMAMAVAPAGGYHITGRSWGRAPEGDREVCYSLTKGARRRWEPQIRAAADKWSNAGARFRFVSRSNLDDCPPENYFNVMSEKNYKGLVEENPQCYNEKREVICVGMTLCEPSEPRLHRCRTWFNNRDFPELDALALALHEFGHWLELGHSYPGTVMYRYLLGLHDLTEDDILGIRTIYLPRGPQPTPNL